MTEWKAPDESRGFFMFKVVINTKFLENLFLVIMPIVLIF